MKKKYIYIALLLPLFMVAQVGINTTMPQAALDINSSNRGVLVPRVALSSRVIAAPITSPDEGELVFNTHTTLASEGIDDDKKVKKGFYYWANSKWNRWGDDKKVADFSLQYSTNGYEIRPDKADGNSVGEWQNLTWDDGSASGIEPIQFVAPNTGTYQIILAANYGLGYPEVSSHHYDFSVGEGVFRIEVKKNGSFVKNIDRAVNSFSVYSPSKFGGSSKTYYDLPKHTTIVENISLNEGDTCSLLVMFDEIRLENPKSDSSGNSWVGDAVYPEYNSSIQIQFMGN